VGDSRVSISRNVVCAGVVVADHVSTPIDHCPLPGELVVADNLILNLGGLAANASMILAKLGKAPLVCGKVGEDVFGGFVREALDDAGVDTSGLQIDPSRPTSQTLIVNVQGEDRRFVHIFGANAGFSVQDLERALDPVPRVLYLGGFLILPALEPVGLSRVFQRLRSQGTVTVLDVACPGPADYLAQFEIVLPHVDVFLPNSDEAALILGGETDPIIQAEEFRRLGARRVVITRGGDGAVAVSDHLRARLGVYPVECVDATGGGDAFDAGYVAGLIEGLDELGCLKLASAMGASCVRALGATAGIFSRTEAEEFIYRHELEVQPI
jgi:sugar/nucleoside kinase (ribokinase family)